MAVTVDATTERDFGELLVGDADDDNLVDIHDYGVWTSTLRSVTDLRADFNLDGQVTSLDFGWIKRNFGIPGDDPLAASASVTRGGGGMGRTLAPSQTGTVTVSLDAATNSVGPSEVFTMAIQVTADAEEVDSADVFIDFDPTYMEVIGVTGSGALDESGQAWDSGLGELFYGVADLNKTVSGTFSLATITFRARSTSVAGTPVTFSTEPLRRTTINSGVTPLPLVTQPVTVEIRGHHKTYLPLVLRNYPLTYAIFGRVTDENGDPIPGVTVTSDVGHSATTDSNGNYMLDDLIADDYTITASKSGYTFTPTSRTINLPPNATAQDFVATRACADEITNGGFEHNSGWEIPSTDYPAAYTAAAAHTGDRSMRVGIMQPADNGASTSSAGQWVTIPADATDVTLDFWLYPTSKEYVPHLVLPARPLAPIIEAATLSDDAQYVRVLNANEQWARTLLWQRTNAHEWMFHEFDLLEFAGQTIKLEFVVYNDGWGVITGMYLDDVALEVCPASSPP